MAIELKTIENYYLLTDMKWNIQSTDRDGVQYESSFTLCTECDYN